MALRSLVLLVALLPATLAYAASNDIPEALQGRWVDKGGSCEAGGKAMALSATTLVYPDGTISDVFFAPEDSAIRIREEATNYEYVADDDTLLFHPEGFGMGSSFPMSRCPEPTGQMERRCGWQANLSAGEWRLVDADRSWILTTQDDDNATTLAVMDMAPDFDAEQFVSTGTYYGYGCACMTVTTDTALGRITAIASSQRLPLATCAADKSLPPIAD